MGENRGKVDELQNNVATSQKPKQTYTCHREALFELLKHATSKVALAAFKIWIGSGFEDIHAQNKHKVFNMAKKSKNIACTETKIIPIC